MCFGIFWIMAFFISANEFAIICSASTWYFSRKDIPDDDGIPGDSDVSKGLWWTYRYHFGSIAFGSLVLALVWFIKAIFEYIGNKVNDATGGNAFTRCLLGCIFCCIDCFDRFLRFLTTNAFIYMAISSENFCESALNAFCLILKNAAKFSFVETIAKVFMFMCKISIACLTTICGYFLMLVMIPENTPVTDIWWPLIVIFCISYIIALVFISVFDVGALTILQCYLIDLDIAKQHNLDPKHIPPTLEKFLHLHEDGEVEMGTKKTSGYNSDEEQKRELKQNLIN